MEDENNSGGPLQVFIRLLNGETLSLQFRSRPVLAASVKQRIYETTKIPVNLQRLICGHQLKDNSVISHSNTTLNLSLRLLGGKGGIVSLLRGAATKAEQNKSSCFEAWRVMSRRSLRYSNAERKPEELKEKVKDPWKLGEDMIQAILRSKADKKVVKKYMYGLRRRRIEARFLKSEKEFQKVMEVLRKIDGNLFAAENYPSLRYVNTDRKPGELKERVKEDCWRIGTDLIEAKIGRKGVSDSAEAGLQKSEEACWNGKRKMIPGGE